jgi:ketosteroid isomerase-like protein
MTPFRAAIEAGDLAAAEALLADDVLFSSPVAFKPYAGKRITAAILRAVAEVFHDFRYVRELHDDQGAALVFEATVEGLSVTGCDFLRFNDDGKIAEFVVMVRPLRAAEALARQMGERFEVIAQAASQGS